MYENKYIERRTLIGELLYFDGRIRGYLWLETTSRIRRWQFTPRKITQVCGVFCGAPNLFLYIWRMEKYIQKLGEAMEDLITAAESFSKSLAAQIAILESIEIDARTQAAADAIINATVNS